MSAINHHPHPNKTKCLYYYEVLKETLAYSCGRSTLLAVRENEPKAQKLL